MLFNYDYSATEYLNAYFAALYNETNNSMIFMAQY